jgi:hypothetical protein
MMEVTSTARHDGTSQKTVIFILCCRENLKCHLRELFFRCTLKVNLVTGYVICDSHSISDSEFSVHQVFRRSFLVDKTAGVWRFVFRLATNLEIRGSSPVISIRLHGMIFKLRDNLLPNSEGFLICSSLTLLLDTFSPLNCCFSVDLRHF